MLFDFEQPDFDREGRDWPNRAASRFVAAGGLRWHVQEMGEGPQLLLVHGTGGATHSWRDLMPMLAADFRVIAPDLPGHGFTSAAPNARMALPAMARSLADLCEALSFRPLIAVGHSAGAAILIRAALDGLMAPKVIVGLNAALLPFQGVAQHLFPSIARLLVLNPIVPRVFSWTSDEAAVRRLIENTGSQIDKAGLSQYRRLIAVPGHAAAALAMMARWELEPLVADLPRLAARLDLVVGLGDRAVPPDNAETIRRRRPATQVVALPRLGHLAHEEDPAAVAEIIGRIAREEGVI